MEISLLEPELLPVSRQGQGDIARADARVVGMRQVIDGLLQQVAGIVAKKAAQCLVDPQKPPFRGNDAQALVGIFKGHPKKRLAGLQGPLRPEPLGHVLDHGQRLEKTPCGIVFADGGQFDIENASVGRHHLIGLARQTPLPDELGQGGIEHASGGFGEKIAKVFSKDRFGRVAQGFEPQAIDREQMS